MLIILLLVYQMQGPVVSVKVTQGESKTHNYSFEIAYPTCSLPAAIALNDSITRYLNDYKKSFINRSLELNKKYKFSHGQHWLGIELRHQYCDSNLVSYCLQIGDDVAGGVPSSNYQAFNYDLKKHHFFLPSTFIGVSDSTVYSLVFGQLQAIDSLGFDLKYLKSIPLSEMQITLERDFLIFNYSADAIGPHGSGAPRVKVAKAALRWKLR